MREKQPGDYLYNVRCDGYDPRLPIRVDRYHVDLSRESAFMLASWSTLKQRGGPITQLLATIILDIAPAREHAAMLFTARPEVITEFPAQTPLTWHTDYAHGLSDVARRQAVHTYALVTADPCTTFLRESAVWLPDTRDCKKFAAALPVMPHTPFQIEPWAVVKFNATELHTANQWSGSPSPRLFFRATYDSIRFPPCFKRG